ncbi:hypothetical protein PSEUDO9AZ_40174 [Pseudomonas sp. 9AZ]|nr:hypothetical protein PSEUDO9AZ_40174 [Pseudomonas sp. 9AZ]
MQENKEKIKIISNERLEMNGFLLR